VQINNPHGAGDLMAGLSRAGNLSAVNRAYTAPETVSISCERPTPNLLLLMRQRADALTSCGAVCMARC